jgi:hypothetical protein
VRAARRPRNALTAVEEAHLLAVMTRARYGHLPPNQLVPRLADEGKYIASESTMYRVQKRVGLGAHRRPVLRTHVTRGATVHRATRSNQLESPHAWDTTGSRRVWSASGSALNKSDRLRATRLLFGCRRGHVVSGRARLGATQRVAGSPTTMRTV